MKKVVAFFGGYGKFRSSHGTSGRTRTMNTYQRQLLDKLISELIAITSPNLHIAQMLAAELKGAMQAQDAPQKPTPDADGWVENTGVDPKCMIIGIKMTQDKEPREFESPTTPTGYFWRKQSGITHYKPV